MATEEFKKMLWDCNKQGCFNTEKRLKFNEFYDALPGKISFSDVDGITEYCGNGLLIEWKGYDSDEVPSDNIIPIAQQIMFKRLTRGGVLSTIFVAGDARDMSVKFISKVIKGDWYEWEKSSLDDLRTTISKWAKWSEANSKI